MFSRILEFFQGATSLEVDKNGQATDSDLQVATAVVLLEMAGTDEDFAPEEVKACFRALESQFGIEDSDTLAIFEQAQTLREEKGKLDEFIDAINANFSIKQRQLVLSMAWKVVLADDVVENYERRLASELRQRLQLTREQAEEAKNAVLKGRV